MSAPTIAVQWLLARAAVRQTGLLHVVSRRDSGALNPVCGANPIRSTTIETHDRLVDIATLCPGCATMAASIGGTITDGVALLLGLSAATTTTRLLEIPVDQVDASDDHARRSPGADIDAFVETVRDRGIVTPLVVRRNPNRINSFQIIDGVRRLYAARVAGLTTIPAVVRDATTKDAIVDGLIANLHRANLNPIEQAHAYLHAIETLNLPSKAELGRRLGISREQISNRVRLLQLPDDTQDLIANGDITAEQGLALLAGTTRAKKPAETSHALDDVSTLLQQLLTAKVHVTARGGRTKIVIDVPDADAARIITQLGDTAQAA